MGLSLMKKKLSFNTSFNYAIFTQGTLSEIVSFDMSITVIGQQVWEPGVT